MKREFVFVEASAGTGKTYQLAKRYITLLLGDEFPAAGVKNILAVTFTNKAAREMRERIFSWLKEAALGRKSHEVSRWTGLSQDEVKRRAGRAVEEILKDFSLFRVGTIDSFIRKIALAGAYDIGLPPRFDIASSSEKYHSLAMDEVLSRDFTQVEDFAREYVREHGGWNFRDALYDRVKGLYEKERIYGIEFQEVSGEMLEETRRELQRLSSELVEVLGDSLLKNARNALENLKEDKFNSTYLYKSNLTGLLRKGSSPTPKAYSLWEKFRSSLKEYMYLRGVYEYSSRVGIYRRFSRYLEEIKNKENIIFLDELNHLVQSSLEKWSIPRILINLSGEISHFLFDEFQDTVPLQWENLSVLLEEAFSHRPSSLFIVGDRKQSIYRFRGGDPSLMDWEEIECMFDEDLEIQCPSLIYNRRSREKILEFVKGFFHGGNLGEFLGATDKISPQSKEFVLDVYHGVEGSHEIPEEEKKVRAGGYVEVRMIGGDGKDEIHEQVGEELKALLQDILSRYSPGQVMILVRKREQAREVAQWLSEEGVAVLSQSSLSIRENPVVSQIVSLMRFLNSPIDDVAFVNFILGDVFASKTGARAEVLSFIEEIQTGKGTSPLYVQFRDKFRKIWAEYFDELFSRASGFLPPYDLAVKIAEAFGVEADAFLLKFFEVLWERESRGENSLRDFLSYWDAADDEELAIEMPETDAVRVMTVHKAKGLEAPVVVVPFAELNPRVEEAVDPGKHYYIKLNRNMGKLDLKVFINEEKMALLEEINNLYVAFTRAKDELYIFVPETRGNLLKNYPFSRIFSGDKWSLGEKLIGKEGKTAHQNFSSNFSLRWMRMIREEGLKGEISFKGREALERGEAIHRVLESMGACPPTSGELLEAMEKEGLGEEFLPMLDKMIRENPDLFEGEVLREVEVVDREGRTHRIDRLVVGEEIRVFEYKTGSPQREHREQLRLYMQLVKEIFPEKPVKGVLLYLLSGQRKEVPWEGL